VDELLVGMLAQIQLRGQLKKSFDQVLDTIIWSLCWILFFGGGGGGWGGSLIPCASPHQWPSIFPNYSFLVQHPVNWDDRQLFAHAMASDFTVTWQFSKREHFNFLLRIKLHAQLDTIICPYHHNELSLNNRHNAF
jgi:hypothetical protein